MNTAHTQRSLVRIASFAFAATVASFAHAEGSQYHGEMASADMGKPTWTSSLPRADIKAATRAANTDGGIGNNGQATYRTVYYAQRFPNSTKTRVERKSETALAIKSHQMLHAGEIL